MKNNTKSIEGVPKLFLKSNPFDFIVNSRGSILLKIVQIPLNKWIVFKFD